MRGKALTHPVLILMLCGASPAQKVQFTPAEKSAILERMKTIPETNADRAAKLKELFSKQAATESLWWSKRWMALIRPTLSAGLALKMKTR